MVNWFKKYKNEILVAILATVVTSVVSRAGRWLITGGSKTGNSLFTKLKDLIFYEAGHQTPYSLIVLIFSCLFGLFIFYTFSVIIKGMQAAKGVRKMEEVNELLNQIEDNIEDVDKNMERLKTIENKLTPKQKDSKKSSKRFRCKSILSMVFVVFYVLLMILYVFLPSILWQTFEITMTEVSPYIDDYEIKKLRSEWVTMHGHSDYLRINDYLTQIKVENGLK